jgi:Flp pilus assembly pilin Flp
VENATGQTERARLKVTESRWFSVFYFLRVTMDLKKAQAAVEYFIIFAIIAVLTILSFSTFLPKVKEALQGSSAKEGFFQKAATRITE